MRGGKNVRKSFYGGKKYIYLCTGARAICLIHIGRYNTIAVCNKY